ESDDENNENENRDASREYLHCKDFEKLCNDCKLNVVETQKIRRKYAKLKEMYANLCVRFAESQMQYNDALKATKCKCVAKCRCSGGNQLPEKVLNFLQDQRSFRATMTNEAELYGLFFDGRKDKTRRTTLKHKVRHTKIVKEEHTSVIAEPRKKHVTHINTGYKQVPLLTEDGEEMIIFDQILAGENRTYHYLDKRPGKFLLEELDDNFCFLHFRFYKSDIRRLLHFDLTLAKFEYTLDILDFAKLDSALATYDSTLVKFDTHRDDIIDIPNIKLKIIITNHVNRNQPLDDYDRVVIAKAIIHQLLVRDFNRV
ncbi:hypothetical protein Bhyg_12026, partial [Pseudolycoriella hygida]